MWRSFLSLTLLCLFMVSNTMAVGFLESRQEVDSYSTPLLQDDSGQVHYFDALIGLGKENLQNSGDNLAIDIEDGFSGISKRFESEKAPHVDGIGIHQFLLLLILFPFHCFI